MRLVNALFLLILLTACGGGSEKSSSIDLPPPAIPQNSDSDNPPSPSISRGTLDSSVLLATNPPSFLFPYSVDAYRIIYYTVDEHNNQIKASGLLSIPKKNSGEKSPLISYQHGTIFTDNKAPSNSSVSADPIMKLAGTGYIVSAADYIGYGESSGRIHPYIHANTLSSASLDMLRACSQFLKNNNINSNGQLFLAGYSEGGYATLALQKAIQEQAQNEFTVTASAAGAGPFDLSETAKQLANKVTNESPAYMSFLLKAYDTIYSLNQITDMYQPQYVDTMNTFFDGTHSGSAINSKLTSTTVDLFNSDFLSSLQVGVDNQAGNKLKAKLALNNIFDWKPDAPTRFYHGPNDEIVPYSNSQKAFTTMTANGATDVSLRDCPLNGHGACAVPYIFDTINFFSSYVTDL